MEKLIIQHEGLEPGSEEYLRNRMRQAALVVAVGGVVENRLFGPWGTSMYVKNPEGSRAPII